MSETARPLRIAVIGAGRASADEVETAEALGRAVGGAGAALVCGGLGGVMEAAARGCSVAGGPTVGILPGDRGEDANPWIELPLATGMGEARNALLVRAGEAVVAVGGSWGTLSEIALARKMGREVCLLGPAAIEGLELPRFAVAEDAAAWALERARERRERG